MTGQSDRAPLAGLRVIDLSRVLAGPYCTMLLADLGADVVKIERPLTGDETRTWGPPFVGGEAAYFVAVNRGKRSCAIDIATVRGSGLVRGLCAQADVVVENFRPGTAKRLGLGHDELRAANPRLVYCSISGFGSRRQPADRAGYDFVVQAESGLMSITGEPDGDPLKVGVAVVDVLTGLNAAAGILAALERRHRTGAGAVVETSLLDSALSALVNQGQSALATGTSPTRLANAHPSIVPYETFRTRDGMLAIAAANDDLFARLCGVLGEPELALDERYAKNPARVANRVVLLERLASVIRERDTDGLLAALTAAGVPSGRIRDVADAFTAAEQAGEAATVDVGGLELVRTAIQIDGASTTAALPPPRLGEHTRDVLRELGRDDAEIEALARDGVVQAV
jgi:crotonobetainyl-CoA:carnitine CoA-transferase CaiB-like acyl-CoA transferase